MTERSLAALRPGVLEITRPSTIPSFVEQRNRRDKLTSPDRLTEAASSIDLPLLLVRGQMSNLVTPEIAEDFLQTVPHAQYVDVRDARHMVAGDKNDIFSQAILEFLVENDCRQAALSV